MLFLSYTISDTVLQLVDLIDLFNECLLVSRYCVKGFNRQVEQKTLDSKISSVLSRRAKQMYFWIVILMKGRAR